MQLSLRFNHDNKEVYHFGHRDELKPQPRKRGRFNLVVFCVALALLAARG